MKQEVPCRKRNEKKYKEGSCVTTLKRNISNSTTKTEGFGKEVLKKNFLN